MLLQNNLANRTLSLTLQGWTLTSEAVHFLARPTIGFKGSDGSSVYMSQKFNLVVILVLLVEAGLTLEILSV